MVLIRPYTLPDMAVISSSQNSPNFQSLYKFVRQFLESHQEGDSQGGARSIPLSEHSFFIQQWVEVRAPDSSSKEA